MFKSNLNRVVASMALGVAVAFSLAAARSPQAAPPGKPATAPASQPSQPKTVIPTPRAEQWWLDRHNNALKLKTAAPVDMLFIGDSITQGWEQAGADVWKARFAPRRALNLGFSGDRTQHVLWRLKHNEVEGIAPQLAVVMIGTNNSNGTDNTAEEIAAGIEAIVASLREKQPGMKILLLAIFPRGEKPDAQREKNARASELASRAATGDMVHYLDIGSKLTNADGTISKEVMPDFLHLSPRGYEIWADAIEDKIKQLMHQAANGAPVPKQP